MTLNYKTSRLSIVEYCADASDNETVVAVIALLTPNVTAYLPPYFSHIDSMSSAKKWIEKMLFESRLLVVKLTDTNTIIGFIFISHDHSEDAHIGYLLGEVYWGKGYASELLKGLIDLMTHQNKINRLIAGVATTNVSSCKLLKKLDFIKVVSNNSETIFYEYILPNHNNALER